MTMSMETRGTPRSVAVSQTDIFQDQALTTRALKKRAAAQKPKKDDLLKNIWRERWMYILLLPGFLYLLAFYYLPLLGNVVAFQDYSPYLGFFRSSWVGFGNFINLLTDPEFFIAVRNTLV